MALTGMDVEAVRQLAMVLDRKAEEIRTTMTDLNNQINNSTSIWIGNDANTFRSEWQSTHVQQLNAVIQGLENASQTASRNADEQDAASR